MEQVLVVKTQLLNLPRQNYIQSPEYIRELLKICGENYLFMDRAEAEQDPGYKQLIPYVTVGWNSYYLCLERTSAQSEVRLHGMLSLGVGGHINPVDNIGHFDLIIAQAMKRELKEELGIAAPSPPSICGLINDDSNPVGAVHLGLHYVLQVDARPQVRETEKMKALLCKPNQLVALGVRLETWSQILLPALFSDGSL